MDISCPYCGQHYDAEDSMLGSNVTCEACGKSFVVKKCAEINTQFSQRNIHNGHKDHFQYPSIQKWQIIIGLIQIVLVAGLLFVLMKKANPYNENDKNKINNFDRDEHKEFNYQKVNHLPGNYEYKVKDFDYRRDREEFEYQIYKLAEDGWEYVGVLAPSYAFGKAVLFRRVKRDNDSGDMKKIEAIASQSAKNNSIEIMYIKINKDTAVAECKIGSNFKIIYFKKVNGEWEISKMR